MNYNEAFEAAGTLGKGQLLIIIVSFIETLYCGWQVFSPIFVAFDVSFQCADNHNDTDILFYGSSDDVFDRKCVVGCKEYIYEESSASIIRDYNLACGSNKVLATLSNSAFWLAFLIACFVAGYVADRFGRRPVNLFVVFFYFIFSTASVFSFDIWFYIAMRFFCGLCIGGLSATAFLLMAENIDKNYLPQVNMVSQAIYAFGAMLAPLSGFILKDSWRYQVLSVSLATIPLFVFYFFLVPESALWLHSKGRLEEAQTVLRWFAKLNNRDPSLIALVGNEISENPKGKLPIVAFSNLPSATENDSVEISTAERQIFIDSEKDEKNPEITASIIDLFKTRPAVMLSLGQISGWFSISLVYYALAFGVGNISGNVYINSILLSAVEAPAGCICFAMNRFGRKPTFLACLMVSSIACVVLPFTKPLADGSFQIVLAMIGKSMAAGGFNLLHTYSPELYPTVLRGTGLLLGSASARVALILAPFVTDLKYGPYNCTPYIISAICGVLSFVFIFFFGHETLNKPLSNTIEEFYNFAADLGSRKGVTRQSALHNQE